MARFHDLTSASMKMTVFRNVMLCRLAGVYRRFRSSCSLHPQVDCLPDHTGYKCVENSTATFYDDGDKSGFHKNEVLEQLNNYHLLKEIRIPARII